VPEGADPHERPPEDDEDGDSLERQTSHVSVRKYEGMPDVKKRMVYIMPALGIGVLLAAADQTIIVSSYGRIGSDLNALSATSWIATAYACFLFLRETYADGAVTGTFSRLLRFNRYTASSPIYLGGSNASSSHIPSSVLAVCFVGSRRI
jgi:hypothetical protein